MFTCPIFGLKAPSISWGHFLIRNANRVSESGVVNFFNCKMRNEIYRNETKPNETKFTETKRNLPKRNEINRNEIDRNETKRYNTK